MYTETHIDNSYFNQYTKQSSATFQKAEKPQSRLSAALTKVKLNMC